MSSWGNTDDAANSVFYAPAQFKTVANTDNQTALFGNTTADAFVTNAKVGQFGVSTAETQALRDGANTKVAHAGWNLRIEGTGGRAGRVQMETLVAMGSLTGDASDDAVIPDYMLRVTTQPSNASGNSTANESKTFTVAARSTPTGATLGYLWQYTTSPGNTATWATTAAVSGFSNQTTATLTVNSAVIATGTLVRAIVSATGAANAVSNSATLTVTT